MARDSLSVTYGLKVDDHKYQRGTWSIKATPSLGLLNGRLPRTPMGAWSQDFY